MAIPRNIKKEHIEKVIGDIDQLKIPPERLSKNYFLESNGKSLPPKYIISLANKYPNNLELESESFNAMEAVNFLKKLGFTITERNDEFYDALIKFIDQSKTADLKTSNYPSTYRELEVRVGFGIAVPAKISWIAFLFKPNIVQKGIYPVFLYYKKHNLLVLAYGVSQNNPPQFIWDIKEPTYIFEYFKERYGEKPYKYGESLVFKAYDLNTEKLLRETIEKDLENLVKIYIDQMNMKPEPPMVGVIQIIERSVSFISSRGFYYSKEEIANFYLSLKAKPFVILAGISGTGKTQLPRKFAEALGMSTDQVIQVPVRPDWTDGSDLLGYTGLDEEFKPKELSKAILKAKNNPEKPYFFILDEMNLARVEHYFSDFLSIIETRERKNDKIITDPILKKEVLEKAKNAEEYAGLTWPENLYLIGTVNMDETTHAFSRKVLDRANSIEMNEVNLDWIKSNMDKVEALGAIDNSFFKTEFIGSIDLKEEDKESVEKDIDLLKKVNDILKKADLHFAYRVRDEVAFYLILNKKYGLLEERTALDFQLVQKVLPRIHGSSERVQIVLVELLNLLEGTSFRAENFEFEHLKGKLSEDDLKYRRSSSKIIFMLKRYDDDRFTSFWL